MLAGALLLASGLVRAAAAPENSHPFLGEWSLNNWTGGDGTQLKMSYRNATTHWQWASDQPLADLHGLTPENLRTLHTQVAFTMDRDAGKFVFEGSLTLGVGSGRYRFVPDPTYRGKLAALGVGEIGEDDVSLMMLAMRDVSYAFAAEVMGLGLHGVVVGDLVRFLDHGVDLSFIRELQKTGYPNLTPDDVVRMRDHGVDPQYLTRIRTAGFDSLTVDQVIKLHDHGVD
jgi:hypothetical protein